MGLYVLGDNGNSWAVINPKDTGLANSNYIYDVAVDGSTVYMLVGYNNFDNYTLVSEDGGNNTVVASGNDIYLATYGSGLLVSHDSSNKILLR